ncbi:hypothetical protein [Algoriphagus taiwanensis]|uniref:DUF3471 domain-containing protein n=1 Tax=Algoriphagus taiwanensis TaxID=1445656 RepID=A0ABQ6Q1D2_9BACT|nr:hypothetical protein Ataiwa_19590 [Algoriphagus taiwanensis]
MKRNTLLLLILLFSFSTGFLIAQNSKNRVVPGKMYNSGEEVYSPKYGFTATIPAGWVGVLPRETEVFLLNSTSGSFGEIFIFGREKTDLNSLAESWKQGVKINESVELKSPEPTLEGDILYGKALAEGNFIKSDYQAFAAVRCGVYCITLLVVSTAQNADEAAATALDLLRNAEFSETLEVDPYEGFDWKEFLSGKLLITYEGFVGGKKESKINLCENGTFQAKVVQKGFLDESNPDFRGTLKGTWTVDGAGADAVLTFNIDKKELGTLQIKVNWQDEELYLNGTRFYASQSEKCD